ncbi:DUF692 family multinuclear iron-containing protein [Streptomyces sp. NPDC056883]|uniref:DUF692 domain-containing protein n=1 Tax=Streptomyces sp. NPDC056883 TaxID=3345959 RepID=UPI003680FE5A
MTTAPSGSAPVATTAPATAVPVSGLPYLGSGIGYRTEIKDAIGSPASRVDWLEVITEHYLFAPPDVRDVLHRLRRRFRIVPHGLELSIGAPREPSPRYLDALAQLVDELDAPWFSDHLCFTRAAGVALGTLTPLPRTRDIAREVGRRAQRVQAAVGRPLILENVTYYINLDSPLSEAQFIAEVMENCECGLLLDLTNLDINARNHGYSATEFLDTIPVERVVQVHLAGGTAGEDERMDLDTHSEPVPPAVWDLLTELVERAPVRATLLERDQNFPDDFGQLQAELDHARHILDGARATRPTGVR